MTQGNGANENILQKTIDEVMNDRATVDDLASIVIIARNNLNEVRTDFGGTVMALPQEVREACNDVVVNINRYFEEFRIALEDIDNYFHSFDKSVLAESQNNIINIATNLDKAFFEFRQTVLVAIGPTEVPDLNLFIDAVNKIISGEDLADHLIELARREKEIIEKNLADLDERKPNAALLKDAYNLFLSGINVINMYPILKEQSILENAIQELLKAGEAFKKAAGSGDAQAISSGPTSMPLANAVINSADMLKEGKIEIEFFSGAVQDLWGQVQAMKFKYNALTRNAFDSALVEEETKALGLVIQSFEDSLAMIYEFIENRNFDLLSEAVEKLKALVQDLDKFRNTFKDLSEREGKVPCVKCGHLNPPGLKSCQNCKSALISVEKDYSSNLDYLEDSGLSKSAATMEALMTENVQRIFDAADKVLDGQSGIEDFEIVVRWAESLLQNAYKSFDVLPEIKLDALKGQERARAEELKKKMEDAAVTYIHGLEDFEAGVSFLRQFLADGVRDNVMTGKQLIWQAVGQLQFVQKITEDMAKK